MSQITQFLGLLQSGQELSLETQYPALLTIDGHEIAASVGGKSSGATWGDDGLLPDNSAVYRVRAELLEADNIELKPKVTKVTESGITYRLEDIRRRPHDPCFYLVCVEA